MVERKWDRQKLALAVFVDAFTLFAHEARTTLGVTFAATRLDALARAFVVASLAFAALVTCCAFRHAAVELALLSTSAVEIVATAVGFTAAGAFVTRHAAVFVSTGAVLRFTTLGTLLLKAKFALLFAVLIVFAVGVRRPAGA